ncbi:MAG: hypothetical protein ACT4P7_14350 [Gemmatimonadaceae bacterium]
MISYKSVRITGRVVFATAVTALGVLSLAYGSIVAGLQPVPADVPGQRVLGYVTGMVLTVLGLGLVVDRTARLAAVVLGVVLLSWLVMLHLPNLAEHPRSGNAWTIAFETLALCGVGWVAAGTSARPQTRRFGRICFGASLPIFGMLHFIYADFVATLIPGWIPARVFWAYATGVAFCAAGVSIVTAISGRLAATLLAIMFGTWVVILHAPRVLANLHGQSEWTSLCIAMAMCGGAWLIATDEALAFEPAAPRRSADGGHGPADPQRVHDLLKGNRSDPSPF